MLKLNERYVEIPSELPKRMRGVFKMRTCVRDSFQYLGKVMLTLLLSAGSLHTDSFHCQILHSMLHIQQQSRLQRQFC